MESHAMEIDYSLRFFFLSRNAGSEAGFGHPDRTVCGLRPSCRLLDLLQARRYSPFGDEQSHSSRQPWQLHHS
jgi:hypothetical protein